MSRYIEENALIEHLTKMLLATAVNNTGYKTYASNVYRDIAVNRLSVWLEFAPTADVAEVVRCKDCMFNHWHETPNGEKYHICNLNKLSFSEHADFFCKYGERREDGRNAISIQKG